MAPSLHAKAVRPTGRKRGGQPGNRNAWKHGRWSRAAIRSGKLSTARVKALAHAAHSLGMLTDAQRHRVTPLRLDQIGLIHSADPELATVLSSLRLAFRRHRAGSR